ncbi:kinase-like domain-containing protein [Gaertneriomyces semiglobifer]|nr:kinase-like domain-containing protein [Gaertneriomyces semiglobifer]
MPDRTSTMNLARSAELAETKRISTSTKPPKDNGGKRLEKSKMAWDALPRYIPSNELLNTYRLGKTLGQGSTGKVKLATHIVSGEHRAVKIIPRPRLKQEEDTDRKSKLLSGIKHRLSPLDTVKDGRIKREASVMLLLHHPHIPRLHDVTIHNDNYYLFMEHIDGCSLLELILSRGKLFEATARLYLRQIISAVDYCHQNNIVHRDLKIENILLTKCGTVKLIDFGLANIYSNSKKLHTFCGSLYFAAPELLNAKAYTGPEVDMWSIGVILYVLVCGKVPFDDPSMPVLHAKIKAGVVKYPNHVSTSCRQLISRLLVTDPRRRATMNEVKEHPWILRGYPGPPPAYNRPRRSVLKKINPEILARMEAFEFGTEEEVVAALTADATNDQVGADSSSMTSCPIKSIYWLIKDRIDREKSLAAREKATVPAPAEDLSPVATGPSKVHDASSKESDSPQDNSMDDLGHGSVRRMLHRIGSVLGRKSMSTPVTTSRRPTRSRSVSATLKSRLSIGSMKNTNRYSFASIRSLPNTGTQTSSSSDSERTSTRTAYQPAGRSDQYIRPVLFRNLFSALNTSKKSPAAIREELIGSFQKNGVIFSEYHGGFECEYKIPVGTSSLTKPDCYQFGERRRRTRTSSSSTLSPTTSIELPDHPPHPRRPTAMFSVPTPNSLPRPPPILEERRQRLSAQVSFAVSAVPQTTTQMATLHFEVSIVKIPWLAMYGIQFRKVLGDSAVYKQLCSKLTKDSRL